MHAEGSCLLIAVGYVGVLYAGVRWSRRRLRLELSAAPLAGSDYRLSRDDPAVIRRRCVLVALVRFFRFSWLLAAHKMPCAGLHRRLAACVAHLSRRLPRPPRGAAGAAHGRVVASLRGGARAVLLAFCGAASALCPRLRPRAQEQEALGRGTMAQPCCGASFAKQLEHQPDVRVVSQAPIAEEFAFRACMVPLLLAAGYAEAAVVFGCPLFFGERRALCSPRGARAK